jgi:outer membrane protein assembly factor BamB
MYKVILLSVSTLLFYSCTTLKLEQRVNVNKDEDWLFSGGDPAKTNISRSTSVLNPPFQLFWDADVDGGLSNNCLSASDGILFVNTLNGEFFTINISTGKGLGRIAALGKASYSAPVIYNSNVILTASGSKDKSVMSYNMIKGEYNWERNINWIETSPILVDDALLISSKNGKIYKLNVTDGSILWMFTPENGRSKNLFLTSPAESGGKVFAGNTDGNLYALDLNTGMLLWKFQANASILSDASVFDNKIYFGSDDGYFYCLDMEGNLIWSYDTGTKIISSSTFYDDYVITSGIDGSVMAFDRFDGLSAWRTKTNGTITASPVIHMNKVFIGSYDKNFYCIDAENGNVLWKHRCAGRIKTTAVIWKEYIFTASDDKNVYCFK